MALIKCSNCGHEVSNKSSNCIHCGCPINSIKEKNFKKIYWGICSALVIIVMLIIVVIISRKGWGILEAIFWGILSSIFLCIILTIPINIMTIIKKRAKISHIIYTCLLIILILYICLCIIFPKKSIDFTIKYKNYLDYALGENWNITNIEKNKTFKNFWSHEYYEWTITYRDNNNEIQELRFDNWELADYKNEEICSDYIFGTQIAYAYRRKLNNLLEQGNISKLDKHINIIDIYDIYIDNRQLFSKDTLKLIDVKSGIDFKEISIDKLDNNNYYLSLDVLYNYGTNINEYTIQESKKIIEKLNIKNAIISAGIIEDESGDTVPIFCLKNGKEVTCPIDNDLDSMNSVFINKNNYILLEK